MDDGPDPPAGSPARRVALGAIVFVATLALLFGIGSLVGGSPSGSEGPGPSTGPASGVSSPQVSEAVPSATTGPTGTATSGPTVGPTPSAVTPTAGTDAVLVGAGDIADCGLPDDGATADLIAGIPGTVFTAGDNAYPTGSRTQFGDCYDPTWGRFLERTRPAPGNHDHLTAGLAGYLDYFGSSAAPNGTSWYSYDVGTWHIIVLDSSCDIVGGCGPESEQGRWLAADLAASDARCTLAVWHHPRWSSGLHGNDPTVAPFWQALYSAGADVVVNGHDHDYERFKPQDPAGNVDDAAGLREFVVGTGGAALRSFSSTAANSVVRVAGVHGVIRFDLRPNGYGWRFISTTGEVSDTGQGTCH